MSKKIDITGMEFKTWIVEKEDPNKDRYYICRCKNCGTLKSISSYSLRRGTYAECMCIHGNIPGTQIIDETGHEYGSLIVEKHLGKGVWLCRCKECGNTIEAKGKELRKGDIRTCGRHGRYIDLKGKKFGEWTVLDYAGNNQWYCRCSCGAESIVIGNNLRNGRSQSCGCKAREKRTESWRDTMKIKYSETCPTKFDDPRERWQLDVLDSRENLDKFIQDTEKELGRAPSMLELANKLGLTQSAISKRVYAYGLEFSVSMRSSVSVSERMLADYIKSIYDGQIVYNSRQVIYPDELDIYIPDKKIAFEFNGVYWHSDARKDRLYHKRKTDTCSEKGIRLIHVFEHEWANDEKREKIKAFIKREVCGCSRIIYARDCKIVKDLGAKETMDFLNNYHIQGYVNSVRPLGLTYNDELVGVMTFGKPRFNENYSWELLRLAFKNDTSVVGGASKLFKAFVEITSPEHVISYCDISKFTGKVYEVLGFELKKYSDPNYVWVDQQFNVLSRYKTMKNRLIKEGYGTEDESESEIMKGMGYMRIYDSGNAVYVWDKIKAAGGNRECH